MGFLITTYLAGDIVMTKANCTCIVCKAQFKAASYKSNKYCGVACYRVAQKRGDYIESKGAKRKHKCAHCDSDVLGKSKNRKRNGEAADHIFCNRQCYDAFRSESRNKPKGECLNCGVAITNKTTRNLNPKYCSNTCRLEHKKSKDRHCISCGVWFSSLKWNTSAGRLVADNTRKTCSKECYIASIKNNEDRREKISKAFSGSNHPNWQGGSSYLDNSGFRGANWKMIRIKVLKRDNYKCVSCGISSDDHIKKYGCELNINHIIPFHQFGGMTELANKLRNLESLCKSCHTKADWKYRKENPIQQVLCFL